MKTTGPFEAEALRILREVPGLTVLAEPAEEGRGADIVLRFAGAEVQIMVQVKSRANAATAWQLVHEADASGDSPMLLIADETTADAREILEQHGIAVADGLGNAHIELPGLLVHMQGPPLSSRVARPTQLAGKAGVAAQALLLHPERGVASPGTSRGGRGVPGLGAPCPGPAVS